MSGEAVEYVRGIPVVKVFQQTVYSFRHMYASEAVRKVTFYYEGQNIPALSDVSFQAKTGASTALVGRSGGGKSTAATLVPR